MARTEIIGRFEGRRIARMLQQLYLGSLEREERIEVTGWLAGGWITIGFCLIGGERTYPVEARIHLQPQGMRSAQAKALLLDLLGHFFGLYLSEGRVPFTGPKWERVSMTGKDVFLRGQERHEAAEVQAAAILAADALLVATEEASNRLVEEPAPEQAP